MTNNYLEISNQLEQTIALLSEKLHSLKEENRRLKTELEVSTKTLLESHKQIMELQEKTTHLQTALGLAGGVPERQLAKTKLLKMVREIDKCLRLLTE